VEKVMQIDVIVTSCARPDILEVSLNTFMSRVKTNEHEFRYVLVEDKVDSEARQKEGAKWIEKNRKLFDKVVFLKKKAGPGFWYAKNIEHCESKYHFHLEDDNKFIVDVNIDPIIKVLQKHDDIVQIMCSRGKINPINNPSKLTIDGVKLTEFDLYSVATGVFNTKNVKAIIDKLGWDSQLHEAGTLMPASKELKLRKFVLGHDKTHYVHVGAQKGYKKGGWRSE
jgi:GT2 family glycosyltransferase